MQKSLGVGFAAQVFEATECFPPKDSETEIIDTSTSTTSPTKANVVIKVCSVTEEEMFEAF